MECERTELLVACWDKCWDGGGSGAGHYLRGYGAGDWVVNVKVTARQTARVSRDVARFLYPSALAWLPDGPLLVREGTSRRFRVFTLLCLRVAWLRLVVVVALRRD